MRICDRCGSDENVSDVHISLPSGAPYQMNTMNKDLCATCKMSLVEVVNDFIKECKKEKFDG